MNRLELARIDETNLPPVEEFKAMVKRDAIRAVDRFCADAATTGVDGRAFLARVRSLSTAK